MVCVDQRERTSARLTVLAARWSALSEWMYLSSHEISVRRKSQL
ncbi:hypothetical protein KGM_202888 [Danaus plexippus plexippus]|uniref:Uncharacterized protein n=1 Tax=Danaus plexippus plexippus TaxID=278856 RepID=A0A212F3V2_DANPL|nr:hypothetical protein KGM_202888 [Danaus plexippus plexippus]